jgi:hypothetical protein
MNLIKVIDPYRYTNQFIYDTMARVLRALDWAVCAAPLARPASLR